MAVPEHRIPVSICLRNSANFVCVRCQPGNLWSKSVSHTLNAICLPHGNHATALYWQFYQHHNITESESTTGKKNTQTFIHFIRLGVGRVGKLLYCPASKENWIMWHPTRTQVPRSVWENSISCLFRKLSWQEKYLFKYILSGTFILAIRCKQGYLASRNTHYLFCYQQLISCNGTTLSHWSDNVLVLHIFNYIERDWGHVNERVTRRYYPGGVPIWRNILKSLHTVATPAVRAAVETKLSCQGNTIIVFFCAANKRKTMLNYLLRSKKNTTVIWRHSANYERVPRQGRLIFGAKLKAWTHEMFHIFSFYNSIWFLEL